MATSGPTVREAVLDFCRSNGMRTVFGNPGSTELRFLRDWPDDFRYVLGLQESAAVAMAAGHALGSGGASLVLLHSAGGVGHALGMVFNAYRDRVPLVIVGGQQTRALLPRRPFLGADEPERFPRPYVKWSRQPARAEDVPAALAEAYRVAMTPPRGPVFLSVPEDDWDRPAAPVPERRVHAGFAPEPAALLDLAAALDAAERPALVVGPGVEDEGAWQDAVALAERLHAAVHLSPMTGRSGFPESHPYFQGPLPPVAGQLADALAGYDLIVALGAPLFTFHVHAEDASLPPGTALWHLDCDPAQGAWLPLGTSVLTTLRPALRALTDLVRPVPERLAPLPRGRPPAAAADEPMTPEYVMDAVREAVAARAAEGAGLPVIVEEAPSHREAFHERVPIDRPGGFLTTGSGALGWGLPLAVGRALAGGADAGERVLCVVGDGSALYSAQALWTAARHRAPVTFVLLDNGGYEAVRALGRRIGATNVPGTTIEAIDHAALATSLGCPATRVTAPSDLPATLTEALSTPGPVLVAVGVSRGESSLY